MAGNWLTLAALAVHYSIGLESSRTVYHCISYAGMDDKTLSSTFSFHLTSDLLFHSHSQLLLALVTFSLQRMQLQYYNITITVILNFHVHIRTWNGNNNNRMENEKKTNRQDNSSNL